MKKQSKPKAVGTNAVVEHIFKAADFANIKDGRRLLDEAVKAYTDSGQNGKS